MLSDPRDVARLVAAGSLLLTIGSQPAVAAITASGEQPGLAATAGSQAGEITGEEEEEEEPVRSAQDGRKTPLITQLLGCVAP